MNSLPILKPREAIKALLRGGFYIHHQTGSHARLLHKTRPELRVTVPIHSKDIPKGTLKRILRQADFTAEEFTELLKRQENSALIRGWSLLNYECRIMNEECRTHNS